jgi:hypothetical protein
MHEPGRFELAAGLGLMVPGVAAVALLEDVPARLLVRPDAVPASFIGFLAGPERVAALVLALVLFLYYVGVIAAAVSLVSLVRS